MEKDKISLGLKDFDMIRQPSPLVYRNLTDTTIITTILLIDTGVSDFQLFFDNANISTFPILYSSNSSKVEFKKVISTCPKVDRLGFIFHDRGNSFYNISFDNKLLFSKKDILGSGSTYSENTQFLIDLIKECTIKNIDFLACNTLQYSNWVAFYEILKKETNVIVGASNDKTGNIKCGGDWLLESTNTDIITKYFTSNGGISSYTGTLSSTIINSSTTLNNAILSGYTWPIIVSGGSATTPTVITFSEDITLTDISQYFIIGSEYVIINGSNKTFTLDSIINYSGLIQNGSTLTSTNGYNNVTVTSINMVGSGTTTINILGGSVCQVGYGYGAVNQVVSYCTSSLVINCGGIVGAGAGCFNGNLSINNCYSTGLIDEYKSGGICGFYAGFQGGSVTITNCYSTGLISGPETGGICGNNAGYTNGSVTITNCYSTGLIAGAGSGGICSSYAGDTNGLVTITNCYSTGVISGNSAGGICGMSAGLQGGSITISKCFSEGSISGQWSGGIAGDTFGYNCNNCVITNCYSIGEISGVNSGGIVGSEIGYYITASFPRIISITQCYSRGVITDSTAGGICGGDEGHIYSGTFITVSNCYMYAIGLIISPTLQTVIIPTNSYIANESWSDTVANSNLLGYPTLLGYSITSNIGTIWTSLSPNTPYFLSIFYVPPIPPIPPIPPTPSNQPIPPQNINSLGVGPGGGGLWLFPGGFLHKNRGGGGGRKNPKYGMICGRPADVNNKYVPGSGVGSTNISVRRAKLRHATSCTGPYQCGTFFQGLSLHSKMNQMQASDTYPIVTLNAYSSITDINAKQAFQAVILNNY